jgi:hypothetical protein
MTEKPSVTEKTVMWCFDQVADSNASIARDALGSTPELDFPPRSGGVRSERYIAMVMLTSLISARASTRVR